MATIPFKGPIQVAGQIESTTTGFKFPDALVQTKAFRTGTSFPGSPSTNDFFYRTDLGILCRFDGTRWLGPPYDLYLNDYKWSQQPFDASGAWAVWRTPLHADYDLWIDRWTWTYYVDGTNSDTDYWENYLYYLTSEGVDTLMATHTTQPEEGSRWRRKTITSFTPNPIVKTNLALYSDILPIGSGPPGPLYSENLFRVRDVIT